MLKQKFSRSATKRGDTIIEVMFAIGIFGLVAILAIGSMNRGVRSSETALELSTARSELNAQAEALRFVHASYNNGGQLLWLDLTKHAIDPDQADKLGILDLGNFVVTPDDNGEVGCAKMYPESGESLLGELKAFVVDTRQQIKFENLDEVTNRAQFLFSYEDNSEAFVESPLSARIIYGVDDDSMSDIEKISSLWYSEIKTVEGMWVFVVESQNKDSYGYPIYYDFYIQACWNGPGAGTPTTLDTVIRLSNPLAKSGDI